MPEPRLEAFLHGPALAYHPGIARRHRRTALLSALHHQPLLQAWYARSHKAGVPYRFFALSNFSSMLALLSYPLPDGAQSASTLPGTGLVRRYVCFALLCGVTAWRAPPPGDPSGDVTADRNQHVSPPPWPRVCYGSASPPAHPSCCSPSPPTSPRMSPPVPFLWILPLAVYLLSFIVCFESPRLYHRAVFIPPVDRLACSSWPTASGPITPK